MISALPTTSMVSMSHTSHTSHTSSMSPMEGHAFLAQIVPPDEGEWTAQAMENWFQACSSQEPFALELVGTTHQQGFVLRASSEAQLALLCKQFEAQYPQCEIERLSPSVDPLLLRCGEVALVGEFALLHPSWMPIKTFGGKTLADPGADPLINVLAAMETVGPAQRVIAQLALCAAPQDWFFADVRKSVEHPLQAERDQQMASVKGAPPSDLAMAARVLLPAGLALAALFGSRWYHAHDWWPLIVLSGSTALALVGLFIWAIVRATRTTPIYDMKLVAEKMSKAAFSAHLRVIVISAASAVPGLPDAASRPHASAMHEMHAVLTALATAYKQYTLASANGLFLRRFHLLSAHEQAAMQLVDPSHAFGTGLWFWLWRMLHGGAWSQGILNALELAALFHLPQETADVPLIQRASGKRLLATPALMRQISQTPDWLPPAYLGTSEHRRMRVPVFVPASALFVHTLLTGMSRSGKTQTMLLQVWAAMQTVRDQRVPQPGVFVMDPHRDFVMDVLKLVAPNPVLARRVALLDLTDTHYPVAINPLDATMGFTRDQAVSNLMSAFKQVWADFWGPRMAYFLNAVCLLLYSVNEQLVAEGKANEQLTLLHINHVLQNKAFALKLLSMLDMRKIWSQELLAWFKHTYFSLPANSSFRQEIIMPILSKMGIFSDNLLLRSIVGQPVTAAPVHQAITEGKIVLCALSSKDLSEEAVNILGSTLINLLHSSFALQQPLPLMQRRKVLCALDEFHAFSGAQFDRMLSEDAKLGCAMLLATQNLKRLNKIRDGLLEMVFSNCQHLFAFRVSAADAKLLEEELQERVTPKHITSQPPLHCYVRLTLPGVPLQIFSLLLAQPPTWHDDPVRDRQVDDLLADQRVQALPLAEVERRYAERMLPLLNLGGYADNVSREARAATAQQEQLAHAQDLAQHQQSQHQQPPSSQHHPREQEAFLAHARPQVRPAHPQPQRHAVVAHDQEQSLSEPMSPPAVPAAASVSPGMARSSRLEVGTAPASEQDQHASSKTSQTRNHHHKRSRHQGKGSPQQENDQSDQDDQGQPESHEPPLEPPQGQQTSSSSSVAPVAPVLADVRPLLLPNSRGGGGARRERERSE